MSATQTVAPGFRPGHEPASLEAPAQNLSVGEKLIRKGEALIETGEELAEDADFKNFQAASSGHAVANRALGERGTRRELEEAETTTAYVAGSVMMVARGIIVAVVALIVLGALYSTDIVANPDNENAWTNMTDTFADYGTTAFTLIGVGLIAVGAGTALAYFSSFGGGGMGGGR